LFLIPGGTLHCAGANNLVLEISATTYIFTFKMYDWQRMDLDGKPRPLNIDRALENLHFDRKGARIREEFVSRPVELSRGNDWRLVHLPTHHEHFYDVHRFEFDTEVTGHTDGSPQVMALVEGSSVIVETKGGMRRQFSYVETFVVPAAAESYKLINAGQQRAMVVKAFVKHSSVQ
jgi:mannose-6-phosphate isomerase class I